MTPNTKGVFLASKDNHIKRQSQYTCYEIAKRHNLKLSKIQSQKERIVDSTEKNKPSEETPMYRIATSKKFQKYKGDKSRRKLEKKMKYYDLLRCAFINEKTVESFFDFVESHSTLNLSISLKTSPKIIVTDDLDNSSITTDQIDRMFSYLNVKKRYNFSDIDLLRLKCRDKNRLKKKSLRQLISEGKNIEAFKESVIQNGGHFVKSPQGKLKSVVLDKDSSNIKLIDIENYYRHKSTLSVEELKYYSFESYETQKVSIKYCIDEAISKSKSLIKFSSILENKGVKVIFKKDNSGKMVGVTFENREGLRFKGSLLDYKLSTKNILFRINNNNKNIFL